MTKRFGVLVIITAMVFSFSILGLSAEDVKNPDTYVFATISQAATVDPAWCYDTSSSTILGNVYNNLLAYDKGSTSELVPSLSTQVPSKSNGLISEDGMTYTFPLRLGVTFHNGNSLTPEDVEYSLERAMIFDRSGGPSWLINDPLLGYGSVETLVEEKTDAESFAEATAEQKARVYDEYIDPSVEVEGGKVVFNLAKTFPVKPFLQLMAGPGASWSAILDKQWAIENGAWDGKADTWWKYHDPAHSDDPLNEVVNGTGPYKLEKWEKGNRTVLNRYEDYWKGPAELERAVIRIINEFSTRKLMLKQGDADQIYVPKSQLPTVKGMEGVNVVEGLPNLSNAAFFFNFNISKTGTKDIVHSGKLDGKGIPLDFFSHKTIRRAFAYAFDWDTYINEVWGGDAIKPKGPIPEGLAFVNKEMDYFSKDLGKAEKLFKQALDGKVWKKGFKVTVYYNAGNEQRRLAGKIWEENIEGLNSEFNIEIKDVQWSALLDDLVAGKYGVATIGWLADYPDPHNFIKPYMHSTGTWLGFQGKEAKELAKEKFDSLISKGMATTKPEKRKDVYYELQELYKEYAPGIMLHQGVGHNVKRDWVEGWFYNPIYPGPMFYNYSKVAQ